jgi:hypothetical protein
VKRGRLLEESIKLLKSELPLNVTNYYKIVVISEIFLIILELQNRKLGRRIINKSMTTILSYRGRDWSETAAPPIAAVDNYVLAVDLTVFNCLSESKKLSNGQT